MAVIIDGTVRVASKRLLNTSASLQSHAFETYRDFGGKEDSAIADYCDKLTSQCHMLMCLVVVQPIN